MNYCFLDRYFSEVREREPYRLQLMELYSTALWHLQKEVALSALAQDLVAQDRLSPAAWCATGNCFSLQKEHDTAIKFFQRAVQVCRQRTKTQIRIFKTLIFDTAEDILI